MVFHAGQRILVSFLGVRSALSLLRRVTSWGVPFALAVLVAGCGPKELTRGTGEDEKWDPSFAGQFLARLKNQSSFRFRLNFRRTGEGVPIEGIFDGAYLFPERRSVKGTMTVGEMKEKLELVAAGDREYRFDALKGKWEEGPAADETSPLSLLEKTTGLGGFKYAGTDRVGGTAAVVFEFNPSLAFMDPLMEKELEGKIWLGERSGLPLKVSARSKDGSMFWDMALFGFNSPVSIAIPVKRRFEAAFEVEGPSEQGFNRTAEILRERMTRAGLSDVRMKSKGAGRLVFGFESEDDHGEILKQISSPGSLRVRFAAWPEEPASVLSEERVLELYGPGAELTHEKGNVANSLVLLKDIFTSSDVRAARLEYDDYSRPVVALEVTPDASRMLETATSGHVGKPIAFTLDSETLYAPIVRSAITGEKILMGGTFSVTEAVSVSVMLDTEPLPLKLELVSVEEIIHK